MFPPVFEKNIAAMDSGRGHQRLLRRDFSYVALNPYSYGKGVIREMAQSGVHGARHPLSYRSPEPHKGEFAHPCWQI
jgi:hypothetical protein